MTKCFLKIWQEFGKEFAPLEYPMGITIPEKIRRVEGKTAFVESRRLVSMTLARAKKNTARLQDPPGAYEFVPGGDPTPPAAPSGLTVN